jgi:hypothetical protein
VARTVPSLLLKNPGDIVASAGLWNVGPKATGDYFLKPPLFRGRATVSRSVINGAWTPMYLDVADVDTDSGWSVSPNPSRYTAQVPGWYWVEGYVALANSGPQTELDCGIYKNGAIVWGSQQAVIKQNIDFSATSGSLMVQLKVGDYVETYGRQSTTVSINTWIGGDLCPCMNVLWVHS